MTQKSFKIVEQLCDAAFHETTKVSRDGKYYAVKKLKLEKLQGVDFARLSARCKQLLALDSPFVVRYDSFKVDDAAQEASVVSHFEDLGSLENQLNSYKVVGRLVDEDTALCWFSQLLMALQYCHSRHVLHRNIKVSNVFKHETENAGSRFVLKLGDLNLTTESVAQKAHVIGLPDLVAPEVTSGRPYTNKADVFQMGCLFFKILSHKDPFDSSTKARLHAKIREEDPPEKINLEFYSEQLVALVLSMLTKDAVQRPSALQLLKHPLIKRAALKHVSPKEYKQIADRILDLDFVDRASTNDAFDEAFSQLSTCDSREEIQKGLENILAKLNETLGVEETRAAYQTLHLIIKKALPIDALRLNGHDQAADLLFLVIQKEVEYFSLLQGSSELPEQAGALEAAHDQKTTKEALQKMQRLLEERLGHQFKALHRGLKELLPSWSLGAQLQNVIESQPVEAALMFQMLQKEAEWKALKELRK